MSILSLAALPAATGVARDAVAGGAQMGQQFLSLLAQVATAGAQAAREGAATASGAQSDSTATALAADTAQPDTITQRSESLAQRIASWLQQTTVAEEFWRGPTTRIDRTVARPTRSASRHARRPKFAGTGRGSGQSPGLAG